MAAGKTYRFAGSTFAVQTGFETLKAITAISQALPAIVSAASHGYVAKDVVKLTVTGMTQLDQTEQVVTTPLAAGTFALAGIDSTLYTPFAANSPNTAGAQRVIFSSFCELTGFTQTDDTTPQIDTTTVCSTAQEFVSGLPGSGSLTLDYNFAGQQPVQLAIAAAKAAGTPIAFKVVLPGAGGTIIMFGNVQAQSIAGSVSNGVYKGTATIKLTGPVYQLA